MLSQEYCEVFGGKSPEKVMTPASSLSLSASLEHPSSVKIKDDLLQSLRPPSLHNGLIGQGIKSAASRYQFTQVCPAGLPATLIDHDSPSTDNRRNNMVQSHLM